VRRRSSTTQWYRNLKLNSSRHCYCKLKTKVKISDGSWGLDSLGKQGKRWSKSWGSTMCPWARFLMKLALSYQHVWCTFTRGSDGVGGWWCIEKNPGLLSLAMTQPPYTRDLIFTLAETVRALKWNWNKTVSKKFWNCFETFVSAKTAVKRFSCFRQSLSVYTL